MRDNTETSVEIIEARTRAGRNQATINIELGLSARQTVSPASGGGTISSGGAGGGFLGGGGGVVIENPRGTGGIVGVNPVEQ